MIKDEEIAYYAGLFCKYTLPGTLFSGIFQVFKCYLTAQGNYKLQVLTVSTTLPLHLFWCYMF